MGNRGHNRHRPKRGGCYAPFTGGAGSTSNTVWPGPRSTSVPSGILVHPALWPQRTLAENWGMCPFSGGGARSPSNTMSSRLRPTSVPSRILIHTAVFCHDRHGPKIEWGCAFLSGGSWVPLDHKVAWAEAYLHIKWHLNPSSRSVATDMGRKLEGLCPFGRGELGPHLTQCGQGRGIPACQISS